MSNGGARPGAGRKLGGRNKRTIAIEAKIAASGLTPLDYMLDVLRNEANDPATRMDAAKAAAPYVHAKLASVEHKGDADNPMGFTFSWLNPSD
jgi:hypothetical protein